MALPDNDSTLLRHLYIEGLNPAAIATKYNATDRDIADRLRRMGIVVDSKRPRELAELMDALAAYKHTPADPDDIVLRAHRCGWDADRIHRRSGIDHATISRIIAGA